MDSGTVVKSCKQDSCGPQAAEFHSKIHVPRRRRISSDQLLPVVLPGLTSLCRNLFAFSLSLLSSGTQSLWFLDTLHHYSTNRHRRHRHRKKTRQCIKKLMAKKVCCDKVKQRGYRMTQSMIQNLQCLETGRNPGQPSWKNLFDSCYTAKRFKSFAYRPQAIPSHFSIWSGFESEPFWSSFKSFLKLIPNSESLGFQSLGPGTGDTKMHAPKNRNSPGTLLEPFTVGLQSWANIFVFVMSLGGLLERTIGIEASLFSHSWIMKLVAWNPNS